MIDTAKEKPLSISELAFQVKKTFQVERTRNTFITWIRDGRTRKDGELVKLESIQIGGVLHSSLEAYERFINKLNESET